MGCVTEECAELRTVWRRAEVRIDLLVARHALYACAGIGVLLIGGLYTLGPIGTGLLSLARAIDVPAANQTRPKARYY